jgi:hypothetical protein
MWMRICFVPYMPQICKAVKFPFEDMYNTVYSYSLVLWHKQYIIQHCFICCPSDSSMSEDATIEPWTTLIHTRLDLIHHSAIGLIHVDTKSIQFLCWSLNKFTIYIQYIFYHPARKWGVRYEWHSSHKLTYNSRHKKISAVQDRWLQCLFLVLVVLVVFAFPRGL